MPETEKRIWNGGECRLTENVILQCWSARPHGERPAWRVRLLYRWRDNWPYILVHERYLLAYRPDRAHERTYDTMRRWVERQAAKPENLADDEWSEMKTAFGIMKPTSTLPARLIPVSGRRVKLELPNGTVLDADIKTVRRAPAPEQNNKSEELTNGTDVQVL